MTQRFDVSIYTPSNKALVMDNLTIKPKMEFNNIEREIIFLEAINDLIDNMLNLEVVRLLGHDPHMEVRFNSMTHQKYFNIILLDLLSCSDSNILGEKISYMEALKSICKSPCFDKGNSINDLKVSTEEFVGWLDKEIEVEEIWLPSIDLKTNLSIKRIEFIKICGNISKHNFSKLSGVVNNLIEIFKRNSINLEKEKALLILSEFYEWFHTNIFNYHSSSIAEFLNNIRWGIYEYLQHEFMQSIVYEGTKHPLSYRFTFPKKVDNDFVKNCYLDLMNGIRLKPYINKFVVTKYLKMRY